MKKQIILFSIALNCAFSALNAATLQKIVIKNNYRSPIIVDVDGMTATVNKGASYDLPKIPEKVIRIKVENSTTWHSSGIESAVSGIIYDAKFNTNPLVVGIIDIPDTTNVFHFKFNPSIQPVQQNQPVPKGPTPPNRQVPPVPSQQQPQKPQQPLLPKFSTEIYIDNNTGQQLQLNTQNNDGSINPSGRMPTGLTPIYKDGQKASPVKLEVQFSDKRVDLMPAYRTVQTQLRNVYDGKHVCYIRVGPTFAVTTSCQQEK